MLSLPIALLLAGAAPDCAGPAPLAEPWTSWSQSGSARAGAQPYGAPSLILGKPLTVELTPAGHVQFAAPPEKGAKDGYGGLFALSLKVPAQVGIALSDAAWVDIVTGTSAQPSVRHEHGPECSDIRKIVWFDLPAGRHIVQVAGAGVQTVRVMAADALANQPLR